ncbi:MAG: hypothetical protein HOJ12_04710, partial [Flavobacteriales bacterium]|nr:hypothetical protein [Flavobacteriales bacterium]
MRKIFFLFCVIYFHSVNAQLLINEYSAANYDSYQDDYFEYEDWVEIYNNTPTPIDINGYFITDKVSNPTKWQVPSSFIIPANDVGIIFCSGRDEISVGGVAHTNFKITQTKGNEVLMISDASQVLLDSISVRSNLKSHSMGRETNGSSTWSVFDNATPATANLGSFQQYSSTPVFSIPSGYYTGSAQVIITSPNPLATIYYTTDGSEPDNTSAQYTTPITFVQTTVLKAVAYSLNPN